MTDKEKRIETFWKVVGLVMVLGYAAACAPGCVEWFSRF